MRKLYRNSWVILAFAFGAIMGFMALSGCGKPLYVGTMGADVYHTPKCKYVQQSLEKHGAIKRVNYHTNLHRAMSGRKPCPKCVGE
ncbi:MAG: hypothetical protein ACXAC5_02610 [Promethearchaeota archaeon]|jgi:hypothetical protein